MKAQVVDTNNNGNTAVETNGTSVTNTLWCNISNGLVECLISLGIVWAIAVLHHFH